MQTISERRCENMSAIGEAVRQERLRRGWSQDELASNATEYSENRIPTVTVGKIERGEIKSPGIDILGPIADALGVTVDSLRLSNVETPVTHNNISS